MTAGQAQRVVIYTRISNDPTGLAAGVTRQETECRKLAASLGMTVVEPVQVDNDLTAYKGRKRPAYQRVLAMLRDGHADAVIVWHVDRLYRQLRDLEPLIDMGAVVRTVTAGDVNLTSVDGRMTARILASVSTREVEHAIERMVSAKTANRAAGVQNGGPRAFGYQAVKRHAKGEKPEPPKIDETEAKLIRGAADAVLARHADPEKGLTLAGICRHWTSLGVKTPRGNDWTVPSLRKTLLSGRIAGRIMHKGEDVGPAAWEPVIDMDTWLAVCHVLNSTERRSGNTRHDGKTIKYIGSGIYRCHCGGVVRPGGARSDGPRLYRCTASAHMIRAVAPTDDLVERTIIARLCREDARDLFTPRAPEPACEPDTAELAAKHAALTARLSALGEAFGADDEGDMTAFLAASRKLKERIAEVERQLADAAASAASVAEPSPLDAVDLPELVRLHSVSPDAALAYWRATYPMDVRRKILTTLATVTLRPARRGRPAGYVPGQPYFDPASVDIDWTPSA